MKRFLGTIIQVVVIILATTQAARANVVTVPVAEGVGFAGIVAKGDFADQFSFSLLSNALVDGLFVKGMIDDVDLSFKAVADGEWTPVVYSDGAMTDFSLGTAALRGGDYLFQISGTGIGDNAAFRFYSGALSVAPVPEAETWAMLVVGSLLVAYQLRRKQRALSPTPLAA